MSSAVDVSPDDLARYLIHQQGLARDRFAAGARGVRQVLDHLGAIQYDTLNPAGRNHDLVLQARLPDYRLDVADAVFYGDGAAGAGGEAPARAAFEYWDKALCILAIDRYPLAAALAERRGQSDYAVNKRRELDEAAPGARETVLEAVRERGPLSGRDLREMGDLPDGAGTWKSGRVGSVALELLWHEGTLAIHHRQRGRKYYDLTERVVPDTIRQQDVPSPPEDGLRHLEHRVQTAGLLAITGAGAAWASLKDVKREGRYEALVQEGRLRLVQGEGRRYLAPASFERILEEADSTAPDDRLRFLAPLDSVMWDRRLVQELFDFHYVWEVYKPADKRQYGYYVLPMLWRGRFVGRLDPAYDAAEGVLTLHSVQWEDGGPDLRGGRPGEALQEAFEAAVQRFAAYLGAETVERPA